MTFFQQYLLLLFLGGLGVGWLLSDILRVRPLTKDTLKTITHMRYVGFMGDSRPELPKEPAIELPRED